MERLYKKSFVFNAHRYEEYKDGMCLNQGRIDCKIVAEYQGFDTIIFKLEGDVPNRINKQFNLPITDDDDILADRVQYGRLLTSHHWYDSNEPIVCNIMNTMQSIRFAMLSPLRMIEFIGRFEEIF